MCVTLISCPLIIVIYRVVRLDTQSPDDPNEISFNKGELLDIMDTQGKWWQAKKSDGTVGSELNSDSFYLFTYQHLFPVAPSNYLQII